MLPGKIIIKNDYFTFRGGGGWERREGGRRERCRGQGEKEGKKKEWKGKWMKFSAEVLEANSYGWGLLVKAYHLALAVFFLKLQRLGVKLLHLCKTSWVKDSLNVFHRRNVFLDTFYKWGCSWEFPESTWLVLNQKIDLALSSLTHSCFQGERKDWGILEPNIQSVRNSLGGQREVRPR